METPKDSCPVCLEDGEEEKLSMLKPCGHAIHKKCMLHWTEKGSNLCPVCRTESESFQDGEKIKKVRNNEEYNEGDFLGNTRAEFLVDPLEFQGGHVGLSHSFARVRGTPGRTTRPGNYLSENPPAISIDGDVIPSVSSFELDFLRIIMQRIMQRIEQSLESTIIIRALEAPLGNRFGENLNVVNIPRQISFHSGDPVMIRENMYFTLKAFGQTFKVWIPKKTGKEKSRTNTQRQICN